MTFSDEQLVRLEPLWERMLAHPFLIQTRDGSLPDEVFARWLRQDYLFVQEAVPFLAAMLARARERHRGPLADAIGALRAELKLFEGLALELGVELGDVQPSFINHAYQQFLIATALRASYAEAYTVLYVAERAYHDSWKVVREGISVKSRWLRFVDNWTSEEFERYVAHLETELNGLAASAGEPEQERMASCFELTARYEIAFWEMALRGEEWPGTWDGEGRK
jgi:thiaminase